MDFNFFKKNTMNKFYLMIPIFELYSIVEISEVVFNSSVSEYIKDQRGLEDRKKIFENLTWAKENPSFDFKSIMNDAPVSHKLQFSNKEVYTYLMSFKQFMENEDFALLTDDREPIRF